MTKFLATHLSQVKPQKSGAKKSSQSLGKRLYIVIALALFVIVVAIGGYLYLSKYAEKSPQVEFEETEHPKPKPKPKPKPETKPEPEPEPALAAKPSGLKQIPWLGAITPFMESLSDARGSILSITSGPEGVILFSGVIPGESVNIDSAGPLIPGGNISDVEIISVEAAEGGVKYYASAILLPVEEIPFDPEPVPPYMRVVLLTQLDSLAKNAGLSDVSAGAVASEKIENGSRFLISVKGYGKLNDITSFVKSLESLGKMAEISRFTLTGVTGKSITEEKISAGFVIRAYDLPPIGGTEETAPETPDTASTDTIESSAKEPVS